MRLEDILKRLKEIAERMENPDIGIDEAMELLEEGAGLYREAKTRLEEYRLRIEELTGDEE